MERYLEWELAGLLTLLAGFILPVGILLWSFTIYAWYRGHKIRKEQEQEGSSWDRETKVLIIILFGILLMMVIGMLIISI